jgi:hypothetical protein
LGALAYFSNFFKCVHEKICKKLVEVISNYILLYLVTSDGYLLLCKGECIGSLKVRFC